MSTSDLIVIVAALTGIVWVAWYFFMAGKEPLGAAVLSEVVVTVDGGYSPAMLRAKVGQPLRIVFDRKDHSSCSDEVVMPEFGVRRFLPTGQRTTVEITPTASGRFEFTCGMGMHRGSVSVDE